MGLLKATLRQRAVPATSTQLLSPQTVPVDAAGNLLLTKIGDGRVRRVATTGTISTAAGGG
ncbi:MAG TPA: hypothetical protein VIM19_04520 [Actinomycetes bacterium]